MRFFGSFALTAALLTSCQALAVETENFDFQVLPKPGPVSVDGRWDDWDLSGGVFACPDVENRREAYHVWFHAMYDGEFLYLLARWKDPTPMDNPGDVQAEQMPFNSDSLQARFVTGFGTPEEKVTHMTAWSGKGGQHVIDLTYGRTFKQGRIKDAQLAGAQQAFQKDADGRGYVQEIALPWKLLTKDGKPLKAGDKFRMTLEANYTAENSGRVSVKDIFKDGIKLDRTFSFQSPEIWGIATLAAKGQLAPRPVRLSDAREFPVKLDGSIPMVDWSELSKKVETARLKSIAFELPEDGYVSLNIKDSEGRVVRQLLQATFLTRGKHEISWDGLTTPRASTDGKDPGKPLPAGNYTWSAIYHRGLHVSWRGFACNGGKVPWDNGPGSNWGGDHGAPVACCSNADSVFLGWSGAEAGKGLVACDCDGNVKWKNNREGMGGARLLAEDDGTLYIYYNIHSFYRLNAHNGDYTYWAHGGTPDIRISDLWDKPEGKPEEPSGLSALHGKVYLSFGSCWFHREDVSWAALLERFQKEAGSGRETIGKTVWRELGQEVRGRAIKFLIDPEHNPKTLEGRPFESDDVRNVIVRRLVEFQKDTSFYRRPEFQKSRHSGDTQRILDGDVENLNEDGLAFLNRRLIEESYPNEVHPARTHFIIVLDGKTGKVEKTLPVPLPTQIKAVSDSLVYVLSGGNAVMALNQSSGDCRPLIRGLTNAKALTIDSEGSIYVGLGEPENQVRVYSPAGKLLRAIGRKGGRPLTGPWVPSGMLSIAALTVDAKGQLWVAEDNRTPKRFVVWDARSGQFLKEYFGPTHYGASGGAVDPDNPDIMAGEGCEWRIDPRTGRGACLGVFDPFAASPHSFVRYCRGSNGKTYLAAGSNWPDRIQIFERQGDGQLALRAGITPDSDKNVTRFWADENGDGQEQPAEVKQLKGCYKFNGGWFLSMNTDLTLYGPAVPRDGPWGETIQILLAGFTSCNAPKYDLDHLRKGMPSSQAPLPSLDNRLVLSRGHDAEAQFTCFEVATGKVRWTYPSPFAGVHGSHNATGPEPGLIRGAFAPIGAINLPKPVGSVWAVNSNVGEWHLLTEDGYYLSHLFESDPIKQKWPEKAVPGTIIDTCPSGLGGEDFGGSMTQGADGRVYLQAGKVGLWNLEVLGLDTIRAIPGGSLALTAAEAAQAPGIRERYLQASTGAQQARIGKLASKFDPRSNNAFLSVFQGAQEIRFKKGDATVVVNAVHDEQYLCVKWSVYAGRSWRNAAGAPEFMYASGDTVDLQLGTDTHASKSRSRAGLGDLRLSIGNFKGTPTAVIFREVAREQHPKTFSSGVIKEFKVDSVTLAKDVKIVVQKEPDSYTVEASIPFSSLGFVPEPGMKLQGDFGATLSDAGGQDTALRVYWNNQATGIVNDEVFELQMEPRCWGQLIFE